MLQNPVIIKTYYTGIRCCSLSKVNFLIIAKLYPIIGIVPVAWQAADDILPSSIRMNNRYLTFMGYINASIFIINSSKGNIKAIRNHLEASIADT